MRKDLKFKIIGRPTVVSMEEAKAIMYATDALLCFHNVDNQCERITVKFVHKFTETDKRIGDCDYVTNTIRVLDYLNYNAMLMVLVHEILHKYYHWNKGCEKITSTLNDRLKPDVARLANILVENTYKVAGYIAHGKISYKLKHNEKDHYNGSEEVTRHEDSTGVKYRNNKEGESYE